MFEPFSNTLLVFIFGAIFSHFFKWVLLQSLENLRNWWMTNHVQEPVQQSAQEPAQQSAQEPAQEPEKRTFSTLFVVLRHFLKPKRLDEPRYPFFVKLNNYFTYYELGMQNFSYPMSPSSLFGSNEEKVYRMCPENTDPINSRLFAILVALSSVVRCRQEYGKETPFFAQQILQQFPINAVIAVAKQFYYLPFQENLYGRRWFLRTYLSNGIACFTPM